MALYDGFFDAEYNAETDVYDREYESGEFTGYFAQVIGSGVCVYNNPDSMRVYMLNADTAMVMPGYLFINGYYLANKAGKGEDPETYMGHEIKLPGTGTYAIAAHLNLGKGMIELEAVSVSTSYPDSLVLAIVSAGTAEDTRYNTDICGVIDSAGEISRKVEYALNYIDTQIESKLEAIDREIDAQAAKLDAKLVEVQAIVDRIVPPPVGTIKFTASQNVGDEWVRCDGSFVSEYDYPELVAALGKLTPGVDSVTELLQASTSEQMSNACLQGGTVWVYLAQSQKLVGMTGTERKEIAVTGVDALEVSPSIDIVLSVVDGAVYLAQNNAGTSRYILLECATFTGTEDSIEMLVPQGVSLYAYQYIYPSVTKVGQSVRIVSGVSKGAGAASGQQTSTAKKGTINYITWTPGKGSVSSNSATFRAESYSGADSSQFYLLPLCGFSPKNGGDMFLTVTAGFNVPTTYSGGVYSTTQGIFGSYPSNLTPIPSGTMKNFAKNTLPVFNDSECIINVSIESRHPVIHYSVLGESTPIMVKTVEEVSLPSRARLFKESIARAYAQGLWFVFVGTGLLFSENLEDSNWGYLDTQSLIGYIGSFGCLNYDAATNSLLISGMQSDGIPKVARLKLPDLYNYANDGAFLPNIASDGVPAFIKAAESGSGGGDTPSGDTLKIIVQEPVNTASNVSAQFSNVARILFNGSPLVPGTYYRSISDLGSTFTVGVDQTGYTTSGHGRAAVAVNGTVVVSVSVSTSGSLSTAKSSTLVTADYIANGLTLQGRIIAG